jgi:hypothetical protein
VTGLTISVEYNTQTAFAGIAVMGMACMKPLAMNYTMFVNPFATNPAITT